MALTVAQPSGSAARWSALTQMIAFRASPPAGAARRPSSSGGSEDPRLLLRELVVGQDALVVQLPQFRETLHVFGDV